MAAQGRAGTGRGTRGVREGEREALALSDTTAAVLKHIIWQSGLKDNREMLNVGYSCKTSARKIESQKNEKKNKINKFRCVQPRKNYSNFSPTRKTRQFVHVMQRQHANTCGILQLAEHQCVSAVGLCSDRVPETGIAHQS